MHGVQRRGLQGANGSYGKRQGVPKVGLQEPTQTPFPAKEVSETAGLESQNCLFKLIMIKDLIQILFFFGFL